MKRNRSLKLAVAIAAAVLASGTTFAWAIAIVGGHRVDRIGTFDPVSQSVPATRAPASSTISRGTSAAQTESTPVPETAPDSATTASSTPNLSVGPTGTSPSTATSTTDNNSTTATDAAPTTRRPSTTITDDDGSGGDHDDDDGVTPTTGDNGRPDDD